MLPRLKQPSPEWETTPGAPLDLRNLCADWERYPQQRPRVFFTLGGVAMLSTEAGVDQGGSICRQFWNWLGQPGEYDVQRIKFSADDSGTINMSLPHLTQFRVDNADGPFRTVITRQLVPSKGQEGDERFGAVADQLQARILMTEQYPPTEFKQVPWWQHEAGPEVLVDLGGNIKDRELILDYFLSKVANEDPLETRDSVLPDEEAQRLKGMGRRLLCYTMRSLPGVDGVRLTAAGGFPWHRKQLRQDVRDMTEKAILSDLQTLDPLAFREFEQHWRTGHIQSNLTLLRDEWVRIRANRRLVEYYIHNFGFSIDQQRLGSYFPDLHATTADILHHCDERDERDRK